VRGNQKVTGIALRPPEGDSGEGGGWRQGGGKNE
jgi:hypothetical protein